MRCAQGRGGPKSAGQCVIAPPPQLVIVLPFVLEVLQPVLGVSGRHFGKQLKSNYLETKKDL